MTDRLRYKRDKNLEENIIKDVRNLSRLKKENEAIKDRLIKDIGNLLEHQEENYYKKVRIGNFCNNNCIGYERNGDRNKALSIKNTSIKLNHTGHKS